MEITDEQYRKLIGYEPWMEGGIKQYMQTRNAPESCRRCTCTRACTGWTMAVEKTKKSDELKVSQMGYHTREIEKGVLGYYSKIREEFEELGDAIEQDNPVMALVELTDLIGAVAAYADKYHNITLDQLVNMTKATQRAFEDGSRQ